METKDSIVHVVWTDNRHGNFELYYKRSDDGGSSWGIDNRLTNASSNPSNPKLSIEGSFVHLVWQDGRDLNNEIYYKRSTDNGLSWSPDTRLTNNRGNSNLPSISSSTQNLYIVWHDISDGNNEIYYKRSTDNGLSWSDNIRLTDDTSNSYSAVISVVDNYIHIIWLDSRATGYPQLYYKRSTNGGINWGEDLQIVNVPAHITATRLKVSSHMLHVMWQDNRFINSEIFYMRSTNSGDSWGTVTRLINSNESSYNPSFTVTNQAMHLVFQKNETQPYFSYKNSYDGGINWSEDTVLTGGDAYSFFPFVASSGLSVNIVFIDHRDNYNAIYFKRNPSGNLIGISYLSSEIPTDYSLYQNFPNPFNPSTTIKFDIRENAFTTLKIYDLLGRESEILVNGQLKPGSYEVMWDGSKYSSGIYFYKIKTEKFIETKKMILLK
jgi:hypothetical protein